MLGLGGGLFTFAALFYFAAEYEHLTGWKWALASIAVTITVNQLFPASFIFILPAQFGLFLLMWWAHLKNQAQREVEREQRQKDSMRERQERVSRAREEAGSKTDWEAQEREREAAAEAAAQERKERVRLAREQREREEREMGKGTGT
jgi:signal transduction histidine kinase